MIETCTKHNEKLVLYGKKYKCKSCNREYQQKWFSLNREKQRQRVKENSERYIERNVKFVFNYLLNHPCIDCGETDPVVLQFDHLERTKKSFCISTGIKRAHAIDKLIDEIEKCEVVCANCHTRRTAEQFGWRKLILQKEI